MKTDFNNKQWGVADFERYYSGKMPDTERHALEKAALDDPFLQDALDGYAFSATPSKDIESLKEQLWPSADKTPVVAMPWYRTKVASQLFKAAAVVIVVGGLGWLYMNNKNNNPEKANTELAANTNETKQEAKSYVDSVQSALMDVNDSTPIVAKSEKELPASNIIQPQKQTSSAAANGTEDKAVSEQEELVKNEETLKDKLEYKPSAVNPKKSYYNKESQGIISQDSSANQNQISGRVVNQQGEPVPNAVVRNNSDSRQAVSSDKNGNFVMNNANAPSNSNAVPVEINAAGYERSNQNIANNSTNNTIVLNETDDQKRADYDGYATKARKEKYEWNGRNSRIQLRNAKPLEGWDYFYYVMNDSISKNKPLMQHKGRMILSFDVNENGSVQQVTVKKSLNAFADSVASKIILKSPVLEVINKQKKGEAIIKIN